MSLYDQWHLAILIGAIAQSMFVILYGAKIRLWWGDFVGRALFIKSFGLALTLDVMAINYRVHYAAQPAVTVALFWFIVFGILYQLAALMHQRGYDRAVLALIRRRK